MRIGLVAAQDRVDRGDALSGQLVGRMHLKVLLDSFELPLHSLLQARRLARVGLLRHQIDPSTGGLSSFSKKLGGIADTDETQPLREKISTDISEPSLRTITMPS